MVIIVLLVCLGVGCKKLVNITPPQNTTTPPVVFSTNDLAVAAVTNMYSTLINGTQGFANGGTTIWCGLSADELLIGDQGDVNAVQLQNNSMLSSNGYAGLLWTNCYAVIYGANAVIEGLSQYSGVDDSTKAELLGEARFIRALAYFYTTNFFGDVPLVLSTNWHVTRTYPNSSAQAIYQQIISDLVFAQKVLPADFSVAKGERIRANKWAATALLARVYLYQKDWADAFTQANAVIGNDQFKLVDSLDQVFNANSTEAILQFQPNTLSYNATPEGYLLIPPDPTQYPYVYLTTILLNTFEPGDNRRTVWIDSIVVNGTPYYYPFKYYIGRQEAQWNAPFPQYYMVLRLGEQYLIRAEAEVNGAGNGVSAAIQDVNTIRQRAGLDSLANSLSQSQVLQAVVQERRIELFAEWGHRWLDLKRAGNATSTLSANKGFTVSNNALLYPIPVSELIDDPNLHQNPGYQ
jgi:hypothetical protein